MATYVCRVADKSGKEKKRTIEAESQERATQLLRAEGLTVLSVEIGSAFDKSVSFGAMKRTKKINTRDLSVFCRQFNSVLRAGVSVITALNMLADQTENKNLKASLESVRDNVEKGDSLATAMKKERGVFPGILINMVEAGEASGSLEVALERMSTYFEKDAKLKGMVKSALTYPIVLICVAIVVMIIMLVVVIPSFMGMFEEIDAKMPAFTMAIVNLSNLLINRWYVFVIVIALIVGGFMFYRSTDLGTHQLAAFSLKAPIFGQLSTKSASARFARNFATLIAAGMPMIQAIEITANTMDNILFKEELLNLRDQVSLGSSIAGFMKNSPLFPPMLHHMIGIGEETGNLEEMLDGCAQYFEEEVEMTTANLTKIMEPMIIIFMAGIVGVLIVAIYSPMMTLYDSLG